MENLQEIILVALAVITTGFCFGYFTGLALNGNSSNKRIAGSADDEIKLANEVLKDQVRQLEAKNQTLEKALEMVNK